MRIRTTTTVNALAPSMSIEGVTLAAGDRVLLSGQLNTVQNGIYAVVASGVLTRAADMPEGARASGSVVATPTDRYVCTTPPDRDVVGTHGLHWAPQVNTLDVLRRLVGSRLHTPVEAALDVPLNLIAGIPVTVDGVTVAPGTRILCIAQTASHENGVWTVNATLTWERTTDCAVGSHTAGAVIPVLGGTNAGRTFVCESPPDADVVGTHDLLFVRHYLHASDLHDVVTKLYVDGLAVQAACVASADASARDTTRQHIRELDVDARSAKRLRLDESAVMTSATVQADVADNAAYVRDVLGIDPCRCRGLNHSRTPPRAPARQYPDQHKRYCITPTHNPRGERPGSQ